MEYHWTPEPYLATTYAYWNPNTDERGHSLQMGQLAVDEKRWNDAIGIFTKLAAGDRTGGTWLSLGNALYFAGQRGKAIDAYVKVPSGSPSYRTAVYNLACAYAPHAERSYVIEGKRDLALAAIKKALAAGVTKAQALADDDLKAIHADIAALAAPTT